ncbi:cytochrome P450 [Pseudonocardia acaciae]|uniref:cytochrome P450 n=1 Tax=Pseudonocardia acaciae TaxID=551276 RepID=UPI0005613F89|nr:cytochrome P450 [Pseudonocardia acaciae]
MYFDVADPAFSVQSEAVRAARERGWYARTNYGLAVLRHREVNALLKDRRLVQGSARWPERNGVDGGPFAHWWSNTLLNLEGEDHDRIRRLLTPAFSPKLIKELTPRFQALADELVDAFAPAGRCEFIADFAEPYAARVLAIMLGIPESEWRTMSAWSGDIGLALGVTIQRDIGRVHAALAGLQGYADALIADRIQRPGDDFVSRLVLAQRDDDRLTEAELRNAIVLLIFGGMDTTRNQLGLAMRTFLAHPGQWRLLAERPELGRAAVEEVMRVNPTTTWITREAAQDIEFQGVRIAEGTTVHLFAESAGTDPDAVPDPEFDITVKRPPHFAFGGGAHYCIGHAVARGDMSVALPLLARRLPEPRLDGAPEALPMSGNTGFVSLPLAFG